MAGKKLISWRAIVTWVVCLVVVLTCLGLAYWQFLRGQQKQLQLAEFSQPKPTTVQEFLTRLNNQEIAAMHGTKVALQGIFDKQYIWFLDNRIVNGNVGVDVLALFEVKGLKQSLLVNLGFIATRGRTNPQVLLPEKQETLNLAVKSRYLSQFSLTEQPFDAHSNRLQFVDTAFLSEQSGKEIYPAIFYQLPQSPLIASPHYNPVVLSPEKHHAYALQWLLIAVAAAFIALKVRKMEVSHEA